jgi:hypothetical protein
VSWRLVGLVPLPESCCLWYGKAEISPDSGHGAMGELLDRRYQRTLLNTLATEYPQHRKSGDIFGRADGRLCVNLAYLEEHGLVRLKWSANHMAREPLEAIITAKGLDFLQDDGGLGAILGVVTVKLHEETIKRLLADAVQRLAEKPGVKRRVIEQIHALPAEATKTLMVESLKEGLTRIPDLVAFLRPWVSGA